MLQQAERAKERIEEAGCPYLLPVTVRKSGCADPAEIYNSVRRNFHPSFLLESSSGPSRTARYSIIGFDPILHIAVDGFGVKKAVREGEFTLDPKGEESLEILKAATGIGSFSVPQVEPAYLTSCFGLVGYDYMREIVPLDGASLDDLGHPKIEFMIPSRIILFDHLQSQTIFACLCLISEADEAEKKVAEAREKLRRMMDLQGSPPKSSGDRIKLKSNISRSDFEKKVEKAKEYIRAGDIIQVVLSRRLEMQPAPEPENFYWKLRSLNPSPYMFFFDFPGKSVIGSSPELLLKVENRKVITRPIAGTRRRGREAADRMLEENLLSDQKERAEHVMLVDLGRNDLGRVCRFGSVRVEEFMKVEKYSHVQHLVSTVSGHLRPDKDAFDAFRAVFPAGTVTGAPKVRAMEIIDELEPTRRGLYAGAVGCFGYQGSADLAITIRTMVIQNGKAYVQVGAGIVADSVPWKEYYETENKARALLAAAGVEK